MNPLAVYVIVFGVVTIGCGWTLLVASAARWAGAALVVSGALVLAGLGLGALGIPGDALYTAAAGLAFPLALALYPNARPRHPLHFFILVVVAGAGVTSVAWAAAAWPLGILTLLALLVHVWWTLERGTATERRAMAWAAPAWFGAALLAALLLFLFGSASLNGDGWTAATLIPFLAAAPAMVVGTIRPDVVDVRALITSAAVTLTALLTFVAVASGVTSALAIVRGTEIELAPAIVICGVLAFGIRPLQVLLRGIVDRLLFGDRPDPLATATTLADSIGDDAATALHAVREALVLPYASLTLDGEEIASSGTVVTHTRTLPLRPGNGHLVVGLRAGDLSLSTGDENVLRIVAPLLAQTIRSQRLARELARSRSEAIAGIEEERRRLRRDLHDGLGPTLTGLAFSADAARNQLARSPKTAETVLIQLRADAADAISEVRRLVDGLRPPALDDLGLVAALEGWAQRLHRADGSPLELTFHASGDFDHLTAALEVAAYRITVEALTNVVRHSGSSTADVSLRVEAGYLVLEITDAGPSTDWAPGVGIASMRERAAQVGGSVEIGGGRVAARLPLDLAAA